MKLTKKEQYLIDNGRDLETIEFCRKCKVKSSDLVWFVERIEKERFNINHKSSESKIKKVVKLFETNRVARTLHTKRRKLEAAINDANNQIEDEKSINSRILHKFKDGYFIINLTYKELKYEAFKMSNCILDYKDSVKNKKTSILALKNKLQRTICHMEIDKNGCLVQIFQKANTNVSFKNWEYINSFFKIYEDKNIYNKFKDLNLETLYKTSFKEYQYNYIPIVQSFFPVEFSTSIIKSEKNEISSICKIKEYVNTDSLFPKDISQGNLKDVIEKLNEFKEFIDNSINNMIKSISDSSNNFFILNDDIIEKLYNRNNISLEEKLSNIIEKRKKINLRQNNTINTIHGLDTPDVLVQQMQEQPIEEELPFDVEEPVIEIDEDEEDVPIEVDLLFPDDLEKWEADVPKEHVNFMANENSNDRTDSLLG